MCRVRLYHKKWHMHMPKLVLEQTWIQVWSLAFLGRSSSFSSGLGLGNKVRNVQSSMSKFGELFKPFWGTFWAQISHKNQQKNCNIPSFRCKKIFTFFCSKKSCKNFFRMEHTTFSNNFSIFENVRCLKLIIIYTLLEVRYLKFEFDHDFWWQVWGVRSSGIPKFRSLKFGLFGFIPTLVLELHGSFEIGYSECVIIWYNIYVPKAVGTYTYTTYFRFLNFQELHFQKWYFQIFKEIIFWIILTHLSKFLIFILLTFTLSKTKSQFWKCMSKCPLPGHF